MTCQGRAVADGRLAVGRFSDPVARELLHEDELALVERVRRGQPPTGFGERTSYELVRGCGTIMVPRTLAIDEALLAATAVDPGVQVVLLGAGLDARAWRLQELAGTTVFEADHPDSQAEKRSRLGSLPATADQVRFVPVDLSRDDLGAALGSAGHRADLPTFWIWEGVVVYLTTEQVRATLAAVGALSAPGSGLVVNYQAASLRARAGLLAVRAMMLAGRRKDPWDAEPQRSRWSPERMSVLLGEHGFVVRRDESLADVALRLGLDDLPPSPSLAEGRVVVADSLP